MSYTEISKAFIYDLEYEKQEVLMQKKMDEIKYAEEPLKQYVKAIGFSTMAPGISIRRIIEDKFIDENNVFESNDIQISNMPSYDKCDTAEDLSKYIKAFKTLAEHKNIVCDNKQYKAWISAPHGYSISRKMLFKIAFILELNEKETQDWLLNKLVTQGFNYRDIEDVVYEYCLRKKINYSETQILIEQCKNIILEIKKDCEDSNTSTTFLKNVIKTADDTEELLSYVRQYASEFYKISNTQLQEFLGLCDEAMELVIDISQFYVFDGTRENSQIEKTYRMLGNMLTFGIPIVDDDEYSCRTKDDRLSMDVLHNELGVQKIKKIVDKKINVERKDLLWLQFFIRALQIEHAEKLHIDDLIGTSGLERAEAFKADMDDYLPECGFGKFYYANPFDNIIFFSLLEERPYETFLSLVEGIEYD